MHREAGLRRFGITVQDWDRMFTEQGGVCAICRQPETYMQNGRFKRLSVDHHHTSNHVRGLLCSECNTAIGLMHDNPDRLRAAAAFVSEGV